MKKVMQTLSGFISYDEIRILEPLKHIEKQLKAENIFVQTLPLAQLTPSIANMYDVVCLHGAFSCNLFPILSKTKYSIWSDDAMWNIPKFNPVEPNPARLKGLQYAFENCESIIATSHKLNKEINKPEKTTVCPNVIDLEYKENNYNNIMYSFGNSHAGDMEILNEYNLDRNLIFMGHTLPSKFCYYARNSKGAISLQPNKKNIGYIESEPNYEKYKVYMKNAGYGVGLCPLVDHPFNECKSIWKFLEYIQSGAISVVSDILPYSDIPDDCCVKVKKGDNWNDAIEYAFKHRKDIYECAYKWTKENYTYGGKEDRWLQGYRNV